MVAFARSIGAALFGVEARLIDIQVSLPGQGEVGIFRIVGMGDGALREGRERIRGAFVHGGYAWPESTVTVNLAPASARKEGPALDLPIALGLLQACGSLGRPDLLAKTLCLGELTLDGRVRPVRGTLASAEAARRAGIAEALVPCANVGEAAAVPGLSVRPVETLAAAVGHLRGTVRIPASTPIPWQPSPPDLVAVGEVRGQEAAVRAATLAAVGGHNLLMVGAPGAGKTLLARALRGLLPTLSHQEAIEITKIRSAAGLREDVPLEGGLATERPFRAPHPTTSLAGLLGGGPFPRPGEVSLAHLGVLFLDELAEFPRAALEGLRQPIEDGEIVLGRAAGRARFPTDVILVGAMNPCPCGWLGSGTRPCRCPPGLAARYRGRISGPLLDRFDLHITVKPVDAAALLPPAMIPSAMRSATDPEALSEKLPPRPLSAASSPSPSPLLSSLAQARDLQAERARRLGLPRTTNARIPVMALRTAVHATEEAIDTLLSSSRRMALSGRGIHRTLRVSRTIADLAGEVQVTAHHVREALQYRGEGDAQEMSSPGGFPGAPGWRSPSPSR